MCNMFIFSVFQIDLHHTWVEIFFYPVPISGIQRFDLNILCDYLRPDKAEKRFAHGLSRSPGEHSITKVCGVGETAALSKLSTLTPGDSATVFRKARALGTRYDAELLLDILEAECRARTDDGKHFRGFVGGCD